MIYITGDTHGDIDYIKLLTLKERHVTFNDYLIICGDAGICWSIESLEYHLQLYRDIGCTIIFIDGNHENFSMLNNYPKVEYLGAIMHQIDEHIFHVLRGEIMHINNLSFLCIGGAVSIDKIYRIPYISWWSEEEINYHDVDNAINNLNKVDNKVDYVITHCADAVTVMNAFGYGNDTCTNQLKFIDKYVSYKHWFFGHYHKDIEINKKKTCLYQKIIELNNDE